MFVVLFISSLLLDKSMYSKLLLIIVLFELFKLIFVLLLIINDILILLVIFSFLINSDEFKLIFRIDCSLSLLVINWKNNFIKYMNKKEIIHNKMIKITIIIFLD